jgi:hypothetical protein
MRFLKAVSLWTLTAGSALFGNVCIPDTLANYIALPPGGCLDGIYNVKDFAFTVISSTVPITANNINVIPGGPDNFSLQFSSPLFNVSGANSIDVQIAYFWDPGDVRSIGEVMDDPPVFPGQSSVSIATCENSNFILNVCPTIEANALLFDNQHVRTLYASIGFPPGVTTLGMQDTVDLQANGKSADINFYKDIITPEPSALILGLLPAGLGVALGLRRRRQHSR